MKSLFIGRWQPFHNGHKAIIDQVISEEKEVVVAIRDTECNEQNPYTIDERKKMIRSIYGDSVEIIVIPDIEEVCFGRKVGYKIREIRMPDNIEKISGTEIRRTS